MRLKRGTLSFSAFTAPERREIELVGLPLCSRNEIIPLGSSAEGRNLSGGKLLGMGESLVCNPTSLPRLLEADMENQLEPTRAAARK